MRIITLQGSPRPSGNTDTVLEVVMAAAQSGGARTETVQLSRLKNITGCLECFACQKETSHPGCAVKDDMPAVIDKLMKADLIVWATPVFCWSPAWPLKMVMDRLYCTFKFNKDGRFKSLLEGRKMAAVITAGGGGDDGADLITETCIGSPDSARPNGWVPWWWPTRPPRRLCAKTENSPRALVPSGDGWSGAAPGRGDHTRPGHTITVGRLPSGTFMPRRGDIGAAIGRGVAGSERDRAARESRPVLRAPHRGC